MTELNLVKFIRLLFLESLLKNTMGNTKQTIEPMFTHYKKKIDENNVKIVGLNGVIDEMLLHDFNTAMSVDMYKQGTSMAYINQPENMIIDTTFKMSLPISENIDSIKNEIINSRKVVSRIVKLDVITRGMQTYSMKLSRTPEEVPDVTEYITEVKGLLDKNNPDVSSDSARLGSLSLNNKDSISDISKQLIEESTSSGIWKTYLTGLNKMSQGGLRNGQLTYIEALQHNNKSGLLLSILATLPFLNDAKEKSKCKGGVPTILLFSFEDSLVKILGDIYGILKMFENPNHDYIDIKTISESELTEYIFESYEKTGWNFIIERVDPSDFGYLDLISLFNKIELEGNNICALGMDYLSQITRKGCNKDGPMGTDLRDLIKRVKNWVYGLDIMAISAHQLSQRAKTLKQDGVPDDEFLDKVVGLGYTEGSGQIDQELDLEILVNLIKSSGETYMDVVRGKHKLNSVIQNESDLRFVVKLPSNKNKLSGDVQEGQGKRCFPTFKEAVKGEVGKKEEFDESSFY